MVPRQLTQIEKDVQTRFFAVLTLLINSGRIPTIKYFCETYNLHRPKYINLRKKQFNPTKQTAYVKIDLDAPVYLCRDYGVSLEWMFLGKGEMFRKSEKAKSIMHLF